MNEIVRHKRPVPVVGARPLPVVRPVKRETLVGGHRQVLAEVKRLHRARLLAETGELRRVGNAYEIEVALLPGGRSGWRRATAAGAGAGAALGLCAAGGWLLSTVSAAAWAAFLGAALLGLAVWVWAKYGRGAQRGVEVTTTTTTTVRTR